MTSQTPPQIRDDALRLLQDALRKPPTQLKSEVDDAERAVVALRDALIDRLRQSPTEAVRAALDQVNVCLSLVVGLEYPLGGLQRQTLEDARAALERAQVESVA